MNLLLHAAVGSNLPPETKKKNKNTLFSLSANSLLPPSHEDNHFSDMPSAQWAALGFSPCRPAEELMPLPGVFSLPIYI